MFKPYEQYKPSGVEWLSDVPVHWTVKRGRFCMRVNPSSERLRELGPEDDVSFVPMEAVGEYGGLNLEVAKPLGDVGASYTEFQDGDVVVAKITPCFENGKGALAEGLKNGAALGTTELHVLRVRPSLDRRFLFYLTISSVYRKTGEAEMYGAGGQKRVPPEFNKNFRTPLPPSVEQVAIADFLDRETAKIDRLVAKKRTLIERLKERRTALISRTVTRGLPPDAARTAGLDPHPKLKPSGIDWLGDVPENWVAAQLRRFTQFITSGSRGWAEFYADDGAVFVRITNLTRDSIRIDLSDVQHVDPPSGAEGKRTKVVSGDVLFSITAYLGSVGVADDAIAGAYINQHIALVRLDQRSVAPRFVGYAALGDMGQTQLAGQAYGGTKIQLALDDVKSLWLLIPPLEEQRAIIHFLDHETAKIDQMTAKVETAIERLQEYRTALITAAVTGKIDVQGTAA